MIKNALFSVGFLMLSACSHEPATSTTGSGSGGESSTQSSSSSVSVSGSTTAGSTGGSGGGEPCGGCPESSDPCRIVTCVDDSCLLMPAPAGGSCEAFGHPDVCNGYGVCGAADCVKDSDCGPAPACFSVMCSDDGPTAGSCIAVGIGTGACEEPCAPAVTGPVVDMCAVYGGAPYYCMRDSGPSIANVVCKHHDDKDNHGAWCCDL